jgi:hypothetical protein
VTDVDPAFGNWLAGFIDGEGSFGIISNGSLQPRFSLAVRDDDLAIVEEVAARTGIGSVYLTVDGRPGAHGVVQWNVFRKRDQQLLVALLEAFPLRAKKRRDFDVWKVAVRAHTSCRQGMPKLAAQRAQWRLRELKRQIENGRLHPADAGEAADDVPVDDQLELDL